MICYKLLRIRKDNTLGPLFINRSQRIPLSKWLEAEDHPTKGYAHRPGWHCMLNKSAPHLKTTDRPDRVWCQVEVKNFTTYLRPASQGGEWILAQKMRVIRVLERTG